MEKTEKIEFELDASDMESAVRDFVCRCHEEVSIGYIIHVEIGAYENGGAWGRAIAIKAKNADGV